MPPVVQREPGEAIEGDFLLGEGAEDSALLLWAFYRKVALWAAVRPDRRMNLFPPTAGTDERKRIKEAGLDDRLRDALTDLAVLLQSPESVNADDVSAACLAIAHWAEEGTMHGSAFGFAHVAALAVPFQAPPAREAARLAMSWGRPERAESWLRRAISVSRRFRDWTSYGKTYADLGQLYARRAPLQAQRYCRKALKIARRHNSPSVRAATLQVLARMAISTADFSRAEECLRLAMRVRGSGDGRTASLITELAESWIRAGGHRHAMRVLRHLVRWRAGDEASVLALALLARAAAGLQDEAVYRHAVAQAESLIDSLPAIAVGRAKAHLARAARARGVSGPVRAVEG
jgi:tetratricopeptide (TPR) repeat protein